MLEVVNNYCGCDYSQRRDFIKDFARSLSLEPVIQPFYHEGQYMENIFVGFKSKGDSLPAFSAHYDKTSEGDGILDNGAAVVELLCSLETLVKSDADTPFGFMFFDGEELGLVGSGRYVLQKSTFPVSEVYNVEVAGAGDNVVIGLHSLDDPSNYSSPNDVRMNGVLEEVCRENRLKHFRAITPRSDNVVLNAAGIPSTVFCTVSDDLAEYWKQVQIPDAGVFEMLDINGSGDRLERVEGATLEIVKDILLGVVNKTEYK